MLFKQHDNSSPLDSTHYAMLYPQNGDRIVAIYFVTSFHPMYSDSTVVMPYHSANLISVHLLTGVFLLCN